LFLSKFDTVDWVKGRTAGLPLNPKVSFPEQVEEEIQGEPDNPGPLEKR